MHPAIVMYCTRTMQRDEATIAYIYVPKRNPGGIVVGSAMVRLPDADIIAYAGNVYNADNMRTYVERLLIAADYAFNGGTSAVMWFDEEDYHQIGSITRKYNIAFDYIQDEELLARIEAWCGEPLENMRQDAMARQGTVAFNKRARLMQCLQCNAQCSMVEKHAPTRAFCNKQCQVAHYIGLKADADEVGPDIDDDAIVGLQTADGRHFRITREQARSLKTVDDMIESGHSIVQYIELPQSVDSEALAMIVDCLNGAFKLADMEFSFDVRFKNAIITANWLSYRSAFYILLKKLSIFLQTYASYKFPQGIEIGWGGYADMLKLAFILIPTFSEMRYRDYLYMPDMLEKMSRVYKNSVPGFIEFVSHISENAQGKWYTGWAVDYLTTYGTPSMLDLLLFHTPELAFYENNAPIRRASANGKFEMVQMLLQHEGVDASVMDNEAIRSAAGNGHAMIVRLLLRAPRVVPVHGALTAAISRKHADIVAIMLADNRTNPAANNNEAVVMAAASGDIRILQALLDSGRVDPSDQNNAAMVEAVKSGNMDVIRVLFNDPRVDVDIIPHSIRTDELRQMFAARYKKQRVNMRYQ